MSTWHGKKQLINARYLIVQSYLSPPSCSPPPQTYPYWNKRKTPNARERKKKKNTMGHNMVGRKNKMVPAPASGKEERQRSHAVTWTKQIECSEPLACVPSAQQRKLVDLVSFPLVLVFWYSGAGTEQPLHLLPAPGHWCAIDCALWSQAKTKPSSSLHKKASDGLLLQSPRPGKGKDKLWLN